MSNRFNCRLERIESHVLIGEDREIRLRNLTISANMKKVPTVILIESLLSTLERLAFPGEALEPPAFVEKELLRPVSQEELDQAAKEEDSRIDGDDLGEKQALVSSFQHLEEYAQQIRETFAQQKEGNNGYIPIGYRYSGWDAQAYLERWERVRSFHGWDIEDNNNPVLDKGTSTPGVVIT